MDTGDPRRCLKPASEASAEAIRRSDTHTRRDNRDLSPFAEGPGEGRRGRDAWGNAKGQFSLELKPEAEGGRDGRAMGVSEGAVTHQPDRNQRWPLS